MFASRTRPSACRLISAVLVALIMIVPGPSWAEQRVIETDLQILGTPEADGDPVRLDVTMLTTDPATPKPGIVLAHGFGGSKLDGLQTGRSLARAGYTVITYTARGFGASGGRIHLNNPAYEGADARKIIDWAVSRREVAKSGGDPVIGFAGGSYGGALSLLVAGLDTRVDAIVPAFTWNRLGQSAVPAEPHPWGVHVACRRRSGRPARSLQAAVGFVAVPGRRWAGKRTSGGGTNERLRAFRA